MVDMKNMDNNRKTRRFSQNIVGFDADSQEKAKRAADKFNAAVMGTKIDAQQMKNDRREHIEAIQNLGIILEKSSEQSDERARVANVLAERSIEEMAKSTEISGKSIIKHGEENCIAIWAAVFIGLSALIALISLMVSYYGN